MSNNISIDINGTRYNGFTDFSFRKSLEGMAASFSFSTTIKETDKRLILNPVKVQSSASIYIDDNLIFSGIIEELNVNYNPSTHAIVASGRDVGSVIDSSIIKKQYKERNFVKLLRLLLDDNGFSGIKIIDDLKSPALLQEDFKTESGDTIFSFVEKYSQILQVFVITDEDGNLVISTEGFEGAGGALISVKNGVNNNIISANYYESIRDRFKKIDVYSQVSKAYTRNSISQKGSYTDSEILLERRKIILAEKSLAKDVLDLLAKWQVLNRKAKGRTYDCQVAGYYTGRDNGLLWQVNTLVSVLDDKAAIDGQFLIKSIEFVKSDAGSFTNLSLCEQGTFTTEDLFLQKRKNPFLV